MYELTTEEYTDLIRAGILLHENVEEFKNEVAQIENKPGPFEGMIGEDLRAAYAIDSIYMAGVADDQYGTTETGMHGARVGRAIVWSDDRGFKYMVVYKDAAEAIATGEDMDKICYGEGDE